MTEAEWLAATDPQPMLEALHGRSTDRKIRCFALACLPVIASYLRDERSKQALQVLERYADGHASDEQLHESWQQALGALNAILDDPSEQRWYYVYMYA